MQKTCIAIMKTHKTHLIAVGFCVFSVSHWLIAHRSKARIQTKRSGDGRKDTDYGLDNDFPGFFVFYICKKTPSAPFGASPPLWGELLLSAEEDFVKSLFLV